MKCLRCQHENPPAQKFCGECGARLVAVCPSCKHENPPRQKFCGECGTVLAGAPSTKPVSPEQDTPRHLAERILSSRSAIEGERKQVTVLFADLRGRWNYSPTAIQKKRGHEALALRCRAEVCAHQNETRQAEHLQAEHLYGQCLALAETLGCIRFPLIWVWEKFTRC
jgi:hypothetical protein